MRAEFGCRNLLHNLLSLPMVITFIIGEKITECQLCQPHIDTRFLQVKILDHRLCALSVFFLMQNAQFLTQMCQLIPARNIRHSKKWNTFSPHVCQNSVLSISLSVLQAHRLEFHSQIYDTFSRLPSVRSY